VEVIYFFIEDSNEKVKIGRAKDIERRRKGLQSGNPRKLLLLKWIRTDDDAAGNRAAQADRTALLRPEPNGS
jgi:hypothetical protein